MHRLFSVVALVSFLICADCLAAPDDVLLARNRTEPVVAVDPRHPSIVVAGSNTNYSSPLGGELPTGYFSSQDGGRSFSSGNVPMRWPYTTGADPTVAIAQDGTVFYSYLGETPAYCSGGRSAVMLTHSIDHGRSFRPPVIVDADPADDKPNMTVESMPHGPSHLFLVWTRWHHHGSDIWLARSADGGATFSRPVMLYSSALDNFGPVPVAGPHGRVYVFWSSFPDDALGAVTQTTIRMSASTDDGAHFRPVRVAVPAFDSIPRMTQPGSLRNLTMPGVGIGSSGALYLSWAQATTRLAGGVVDADIKLSRSANGGHTWSKPVRINDVRRGDRFMPAVTVWRDGSVGIAFYDRRNGGGAMDLYAARAVYRDGFQVSPNVRVNGTASPVSDIYYLAPGSTCFEPGRFFGDYIGVAPAPHHVLCVVWADTQLHIPNETDIWFARVGFRQP